MALKLIVYTDDYGAGGAGEYTHRVALGLAGIGHEIVYVCSRNERPPIAEREAAGIRHLFLDYDTIAHIPFAARDRRTPMGMFLAEMPDLVLFSDCLPESLVAAKEAADFLGIPFIAVKHFVSPDTWAAQDPAMRRRTEAALGKAFAVVPVSNENGMLLSRLFELDRGRLRTIYNGRPERFFKPRDPETRAALRREWGIPDDGLVVLTVAQFVKRKGYQYIVEAMTRLQAEGQIDRFHFVWASAPTPAIYEPLKQAMDAAGCADRVRLLGHRDDIDRCLDAADIFLLPSEREGMPLVIIEAMAKGVPVIASAVSGIPEELGDCGSLLPDPNRDPAGTVRAIGSALRGWRDDPAELRRQGEASIARARGMFHESRTLGELTALIDAAIFPPNDYVSPGFERIRLDAHFPQMIDGDHAAIMGPVGRAGIPHRCLVDLRHASPNFLNRDEIHIVYNTALRFRGRRALEIGTWFGWATLHLFRAGVELDAVDLSLTHPLVRDGALKSLRGGGARDIRLGAGPIVEVVRRMVDEEARRWSLFLLGVAPGAASDPEGEAAESLRGAEPDALVLLPDMVIPRRAAVLRRLRDEGWNIRLYDTARILGVAWRGDVRPVDHVPDPRVNWTRPPHLADLA